MKKIWYVAKVILGVILVLVAAHSLNSFSGFMELIFGAGFMLAGVMLGLYLEKHHSRIFLFIIPISFLLTLFSSIQHFFGGILIYFACAMVFGRKNPVIS